MHWRGHTGIPLHTTAVSQVTDHTTSLQTRHACTHFNEVLCRDRDFLNRRDSFQWLNWMVTKLVDLHLRPGREGLKLSSSYKNATTLFWLHSLLNKAWRAPESACSRFGPKHPLFPLRLNKVTLAFGDRSQWPLSHIIKWPFHFISAGITRIPGASII